MALLAGAVLAGGLAAAGGGIYSANQAGKSAKASNALQQQAMEQNRRDNAQQRLLDMITMSNNLRQQAIDNGRYDEAKRIEDTQRAFTNRLSTASQTTVDGATVGYDPLSGNWGTNLRGQSAVNDARRTGLEADQYQQALVGQLVGGKQAIDRRSQGGMAQSQERALGQELLAKYGANQGRTNEQMQGAGIEAGVAGVTGGSNPALLQGWRQGNSGSDALVGAMARQSNGGTRAAIANARQNAPQASFAERDSASKSYLTPANTLTSRGNANPDTPSPVYSGDSSSGLLAAINRNNPAGVGTTLNPRSTAMGFTPRPTPAGAYSPLNANGIAGMGYQEALKSLLGSQDMRNAASTLYNRAWGDSSKGLNYTGGASTNSAIYSDPSPLQ